MTESEIFTDESEALYYRLRAIRDELERSEDTENDDVLNGLLSSTYDSIESGASAEYKEKARSIVVKKSDPNVSSVLFQEKMLKVESIGGIALLLGGLAAAAVSIFGSGTIKFGLTAVIFLFAGVVCLVASRLLQKFSMARLKESYKALEGKTIIGMRLKKRDFNDGDNGSARMKEIAEQSRKKSIKAAIIVLAVLAVVLVGGYLIYSKVIQPSQKYESAEQAFKDKKYSEALSLYNELDDGYKDTAAKKEALRLIGNLDNEYDKDYESTIKAVNDFGLEYKDIADEIIARKNEFYYKKAEECFNLKKYSDAANYYGKASGYNDADAKKDNSVALGYYFEAEEKAKTSIKDAMIILNGNHVSVSVKGKPDAKELISTYEKYLTMVGKYVSGEDVFNVTGYSRKDSQYYAQEEKLGKLAVEESDNSEYVYKITIAEDNVYYVNKDQVLHKYIETYEDRGRERTREVTHVLKK